MLLQREHQCAASFGIATLNAHQCRFLTAALGAQQGADNRLLLQLNGGILFGLGLNHAGCHGGVGQAVDDDERAGALVTTVVIRHHGAFQADLDLSNLVQSQCGRRALFQRIHVDAVTNGADTSCRAGAGQLDFVAATRNQLLLRHPDQMRGKAVGDFRHLITVYDQVATGDVDFVFQRQRY